MLADDFVCRVALKSREPAVFHYIQMLGHAFETQLGVLLYNAKVAKHIRKKKVCCM